MPWSHPLTVGIRVSCHIRVRNVQRWGYWDQSLVLVDNEVFELLVIEDAELLYSTMSFVFTAPTALFWSLLVELALLPVNVYHGHYNLHGHQYAHRSRHGRSRIHIAGKCKYVQQQWRAPPYPIHMM